MLTEHCRETLPDHPVEIMNYAARHSYFEILDAAAPLTISLPVSEVLRSLSGLFVVPYVRSTFDHSPLLRVHISDRCSTSKPGGTSSHPHVAARPSAIAAGTRPASTGRASALSS